MDTKGNSEAIKLLRRKADQGNASAQFKLGFAYANGEGVPQNHAEAVKWYRKAAEQEHAGAQNNLAVRYDRGEGVPQNYAEAVKWYRKGRRPGQRLCSKQPGGQVRPGRGRTSEITPKP